MRFKFRSQCKISWKHSHLPLTNEYYAKYEAISTLIDEHPAILSAVHRDLETALKSPTGSGDGFRYTSEQVLRILVSQVIEGVSLRGIVIRIDDSRYLRDFVRIYDGPMMDYTTLCKLKNAIRPETWKQVNKALARSAAAEGWIGGDQLRMDTTLVETNIHWPTDSSLLWDTYRILSGLLDKVREREPEILSSRRLHRRRVKRLMTQIARASRAKGRSAKALKPRYKRLIGHVEGVCDLARSVQEQLLGAEGNPYWATRLSNALRDYEALGRRVTDQARRRVLQGEQVPNEEKLFSIVEPHTELLKRGKAGKPIEFGHMIQIQQVPEKFITDYDVFETKPVEHALLKQALQSHRDLFGSYPDRVTADKGYYESMEAITQIEKTIQVVAIGKKGKRTKEETARENDPLFRLAQRFRAGVEGSISFLKRVLGLSRCFNKGWEHFQATVGTTVFVHNLLILARC
jgi:IS5 family transposase